MSGEKRAFPGLPLVGHEEFDPKPMLDEIAKVVSKHMRGGVAQLGFEIRPGTLDPGDKELSLKYLITRRPWTGMERMRDSIDGNR
jgi:hypothetical protein